MIGFGQAKKESFILTMRNVNKSKEYELQMIRLGFILTMRNVNSASSKPSRVFIVSFILTMRNVNILVPSDVKNVVPVLY